MMCKACACARLTAENTGSNCSGVRTPTKLSSIASAGAAALRSSTAFGWYGVSGFQRTATRVSRGIASLSSCSCLALSSVVKNREPGDVAARMCEVRNQAGPDWIGHQGHDDGNSGRGTLCRLGCNRAVHDDHIDLALHQVGGQRGYLIVIAAGRSPFDHYVASLHVARVPQPLPKRLRLLALG